MGNKLSQVSGNESVKIALLVVLLIIGTSWVVFDIVSAVEPTQQSNKIFLNPFYRTGMTLNTNYTYTVAIIPPDNLNSVSSAIISFDFYISPTVNFNIWVNGQTCNTPSYSISTTYASAGQGRITFDCSNVINKAGVYTVTIRTSKDTGASTGWLDVTYINKPKGQLTIHGTEYTTGQYAKTWLQLLDNNGSYINNGICFTDIYTPSNTQYLENAQMTNMNHDGIYYYDLAVPLVDGVYPVIAKCYYTTLETNYYPNSVQTAFGNFTYSNISTDDFESNNFSGGKGWIGIWESSANVAIWNTGAYQGTYLAWLRSTSARLSRRVNTTGYNNVTLSFAGKVNSFEGSDNTTLKIRQPNGTDINLRTWTSVDSDNTWKLYSFNLGDYGINTNGVINISWIGGMSDFGDEFHIDVVNVTGSNSFQAGALNKTDGIYVSITESNSTPARLDANLSFSPSNMASCLNISESLFTGINVFVNGQFSSVPNDDITIGIYNWTGNYWSSLPNVLSQGAGFKSVSNSITTSNITKSGFYSSTYGIRLRVNDTAYADSSVSALFLDEVHIGCDQLTNMQWQEVKGSSEIHLSTSQNAETFYVSTFCGSNEENKATSACTLMENNLSFFNKTQGYLHDTIHFINSRQTTIASSFDYETSYGQDCTATWLVEKRNNESEPRIDVTNQITYSSGTKENCIFHIPVNFASGSDREFILDVYQDNYMKWEVQRNKDYVNYFDLIISPYCNKLAIENNNPFVIPLDDVGGSIDISLIYASNPVYLACYRMLDDIYWFNYYYNESFSINSTGEYEAYLSENKYYYPEIRENAKIIQDISGKDLLQNVYTLCGANNSIKDYSCALIKSPDAIFSSQEGYILENLSAENLFNATVNTEYIYETATGVDCTAVFQVLKQNGTTTDITNNINYAIGNKDNCEMRIPINMITSQSSYQIEIYMENYILWDIYWARDNVNFWNDTVADYCSDIAMNRSLSYNLPINSSIEPYRNDSEFYFCYRAMDDLYWWYFFYNDLRTSGYTMVGQIESDHYESEFFWTKILNDYNTIKTYQRNLNQIQTLQDILDIKNNMAGRVWNYTDRNLTYYPASSGSINNTAIAEAVWSYSNRTLSIDGITQIVNAVWSYSGTLASTILTQISNSTWLWSSRNLTFYPTSEENASAIAEAVWNSTNKNLSYYPPMNVTTQIVNVQNVTVNVTTQNVTVQDVTVNATTQILNITVLNQTVNVQNVTLNVENVTVNITTQVVNVTTEVVNLTTQNVVVQNYTIEVQNVTVNMTTQNVVVQNITLELLNVTWEVNPIINVTTQVVNVTTQNVSVQNITINSTEISDAVWMRGERNLTYYQNFTVPQSDLTNYTLIQEMVWNATQRTLTEFNFTVVVNDSSIADSVWNHFNRTLSEFNFTVDVNQTQIAGAVWNYYSRTLTEYNQSDLTNYTLIQSIINNAQNNLTAQDIWNFIDRNLTYYPSGQNMSDFADAVWSHTPDRNLTYYPPMDIIVNATVNVSADDIATAVWNYNGTISGNILNQFSNKISCVITNLLNLDVGNWGVDIMTC